MVGMNRWTGAPIDGWEDVEQSVQDIVTTPIGTRVMRRDYGCNLGPLLDQPGSQQRLAAVTMAIVVALNRWEPRFQLTNIAIVSASMTGVFEIDMRGVYFPRGHLGDRTIVETVHSVRVRL